MARLDSDQRISGAFLKKEYRAGVCAGGFGESELCVKVEIRGQGVGAVVVPTAFLTSGPKKTLNHRHRAAQGSSLQD